MNEDYLIQQLAKVAEDSTETKTMVREIHNKLFDNRVGLEVRIDNLEAARDQGKGVIWFLSLLVTISGLGELVHWIRR